MTETVVHGWDARVGRDPQATIPAEWAAEAKEAADAYLLNVSGGGGPVTIAKAPKARPRGAQAPRRTPTPS